MAIEIKSVVSAVDHFTGPLRGMISGVKSAASGAASVLGSVGSIAKGLVKGIAGGVASLAGLQGGIIAAGSQFVNSTAEMYRFAKSVGVTTEQLQELRYAAKSVGVDAETLDKGVSELDKRMGQLRGGSGSLDAFLKKVSPALLKQVKGAKSTAEAFELITQAMSQLPDSARKVALADAAFGGAGESLVRLGSMGKQGLADAAKQARAFGIVSDATAQQADVTAKSFTDFKASIGGIANELGASLVPMITPLINGLRDWIAANKQVIGARIQAVIAGIASAARSVNLSKIVDGLKAIWNAVQPLVTGIVEWIRSHWTEIKVITGQVFEGIVLVVKASIKLIIDLWNTLTGPVIAVWDSIKRILSGFLDFVTGVFTLDFGKAFDGLSEVMGGLADFFASTWEGVKAIFVAVGDWFGTIWDRYTPDKLKESWSAVTGFFKSLWEGVVAIFDWAYAKIKATANGIKELAQSTVSWIPGYAALAHGNEVITGLIQNGIGGSAEPMPKGGQTLGGIPVSSLNRSADYKQAQNTPPGLGKLIVDFRNMPQGVTVEQPGATANPHIALNVGPRMVNQ